MTCRGRISWPETNFPPVTLPAPHIIPPLVIPLQQVLPEAAAVVEEEIASSRLLLEEEIDQFRFGEEEGELERPLQILDFETESDRHFAAFQPELVVARVDISSEERSGMDLKKRPSLKGLIANRNKEEALKDAPKAQIAANLPLPPFPIDLGLHTVLDLKKKRPVQELEEGEVVPPKGTKQQKTRDPRDRMGNSVDSREDAKVRRQQRSWASRLELDGAQIPGTLLIGNPREGMWPIWLKLWSSLFYFQGIWKLLDALGNRSS